MESLSEILTSAFSFGTGFLKIVLGVGLVIFVHELGHFLAARWCGVRVETFSLGMGPALVSWQPGPTRYQIAAVPLGGYCRMAGEDRLRDDRPPRPDDLLAKSVGARFFIYSGGVVMNVLFGLLVFPILFHFGVPFSTPTIGDTTPGTPAWHARIAPGSEVLEINGNSVLEFNDILTEVALQPEGSTLLLRDPATGRTRETHLVPRYNENAGLPMIGVRQATATDERGRPLLTVAEDTPAARAGLQDGDALIEVVDALPGLDVWTQLWEAMNAGETLRLRVDGEEGERTVEIAPDTHDRSSPPMLGIAAPQVLVRDVRQGPETTALDLRPDDRLLAVQGEPVRRSGDLQRLLIEHPGPLRLDVRRGDERLTLEGPPLGREEALSLASDVFLVSDIQTTAIVVMPGWPGARAGLVDGDRVLQIDGTDVEDWEGLTALLGRAARDERAAVLQIERSADAGPTFLEIAARPEPRPLRDYGLDLRPAKYVYQASSLGEAVLVGADRSWRFLQNAWVMLKRIVQGNISAEKNVGGIITIAVVSHTYASVGLVSLFFFLAILSINLAFINVLPIPVLDGGHLFFLIVEKIKGSPVSDRILGYSQMVGVVLILSLLVYVTYNDLVRWVFSGWIFRL